MILLKELDVRHLMLLLGELHLYIKCPMKGYFQENSNQDRKDSWNQNVEFADI